MDLDFNLYALSLIISGIITLLLSGYILSNEKGTVRWVGYLMLSNSVWSLAYGFELASKTLEHMKMLIDVEYLGIVAVPFYWFLFCLDLAGKEKWLKKPGNQFLITAVPVLYLLLVWTNNLHHLHYKKVSVDYSGSFPMLKIVPGIAFYFFICYFYALLIVGNYFLVKKFRRSDRVYKKQNRVILTAAMLPWIANFSYLIGLRPIPNLDITPFAFQVSTFLIFIAIYRFKLLNVLPVAREKVLELMGDGFMVLDHRNRVIDYNSAFKKYISVYHADKIIGKDVNELLQYQPELLDLLNQQESGKVELLVHTANGVFDLEADVCFLNENKLNRNATIIKLQDLTNARQEALKSQRQAEELQKLNQLKDRIFSIMAHDLRGPLLNLAEVLKMTSDDTISAEEFKDLSPTLTKDISYTTDLLENILHWSRSQLKGYGINKDLFDLKKLISSEVSYHLKAASVKKIKIVQQLTDDLVAYADLLMMQIVIRNLIINAIKFCHENCQINITAAYINAEYIGLQIQDNGVGIAIENIQKIFNGENFSSRGTQNEKGTGIGLMVCWDFMERNEGSITIESELGTGTLFNLRIPRHQA
ncbi:signal transduction histidine kinase [Pedobacter cryoconitis]|uniref:histidine kinase n=1 Tax=Pedobacter cryoconitis TaxID=188932 RepID=A0A7W8YX64_9SPHI|nr:histidine kinase N-terminal 7TM domain-containing protein [Pedobacter cryoconitis]MBB5623420.1 signal transduction histidine kinase [Pedobacter cryoconitis]MBB5646595.1 signal transduction histidine kinase [Pedobacter cryoconitis]